MIQFMTSLDFLLACVFILNLQGYGNPWFGKSDGSHC